MPEPSSESVVDNRFLIGNASARAIHGFSAGADCVLVGTPAVPVEPVTDTTTSSVGAAPQTGRSSGPGSSFAAGPSSGAGAVLAEVCAPATVGTAAGLAGLADLAASGSGPLVLADAGLLISLPGVLDLLDSPADRTAALLADPRNIEAPRQAEEGMDRATLVRLGPEQTIEAAGTAEHGVDNPNRVSVGMLRIRAADRVRAAELWRQAVDLSSAPSGSRSTVVSEPDLLDQASLDHHLFDQALLVLVRGGQTIAGQALGYYTWSRAGQTEPGHTEPGQTQTGQAHAGPAPADSAPADPARIGQQGIGGSPWQQRLRSASRLGDGAYSAAVVRPLSRIGTRLALRVGLSPNVVTAISLAVGLLAGLLILTDSVAGWIAAAVLLQLALVIDCMDGEIARFTRRFSAFGGWLDGIGDRIKEYVVFAAVGAVAVRDGHDAGWLLAIIAMVIVTARHLEDYAYTDRTAAVRHARAAAVPTTRSAAAGRIESERQAEVGRTEAGRTEAGRQPSRPARTTLPAPASRRQRLRFWAKKIAHVPIAERYLILSLTLLTCRPIWVLVAAIAVSTFALAWVVGGRLLRALADLSDCGWPIAQPPSDKSAGVLDHQLDLGVLARTCGQLRLGFLPGVVALIVCWVAMVIGICTGWWPVTLIAAVPMIFVLGCTLRSPVRHRLGWLSLALVWVGEAAVITALLRYPISGLLVFVAVAAVAYRRYELIYSIRLRGIGGPAPVLGVDGRLLLVAVLVTLAELNGHRGEIIGWGLVLFTIETLAEAIIGTVRRWRPRRTAGAGTPS